MSTPEDYLFTDEHEWAREEDNGTVTVGITEHAQELLGDVVFIELPHEGDTVEAGVDFGVIESVKTASELYSPVAGEIVEVHEDLLDAPEWVNESPYEKGWMIRVDPEDSSELDGLMEADEYDEFVLEQQD